jgi:hypothetical protein
LLVEAIDECRSLHPLKSCGVPVSPRSLENVMPSYRLRLAARILVLVLVHAPICAIAGLALGCDGCDPNADTAVRHDASPTQDANADTSFESAARRDGGAPAAADAGTKTSDEAPATVPCASQCRYVAFAGDDSNPGTESKPWRTIKKSTETIQAGEVAVVMTGTYDEAVTTTMNGTLGGRITFQASGLVTTRGWTIRHDYITVDGFHLTPGSEVTISSRDAANGSHCQVLRNDLTSGSISMAFKSRPTGCLIHGNHLHDMISPDGDAPQIQIWGTNNIVARNDIGPNSDIDAFRFWGSGHIIRNNYVHDTTYSPNSKAHSDGFQTFGDNGDEAHDIVIEANRFINSQGQLFNTSQDNVAGIHDLIVRNNVWVNYSQNANVGLPNMYFYNNTLYNTGIIYQVTGGPGQPFNGSNLMVKNNILVGLAGCANRDFDNVYNNPSALPFSRSNNFYSDCTNHSMLNYTGESYGINGGDIGFISVSVFDFHLQSNSPVIDKGAFLNFGTDADGVVRPQRSAWDVGAYETP